MENLSPFSEQIPLALLALLAGTWSIDPGQPRPPTGTRHEPFARDRNPTRVSKGCTRQRWPQSSLRSSAWIRSHHLGRASVLRLCFFFERPRVKDRDLPPVDADEPLGLETA